MQPGHKLHLQIKQSEQIARRQVAVVALKCLSVGRSVGLPACLTVCVVCPVNMAVQAQTGAVVGADSGGKPVCGDTFGPR